MRRTKEEAEVTRQRLLKAALVVFSRQGYADTRLEDIADEAEVTRGAIYHHFGGKAELYGQLMAESSVRIMQVINDAVSEGGSALDVLKHVFVGTLVYAAEDPDFQAVSELALFKSAVVPELAEGMQKKIQGTRQMTQFFSGWIQRGIGDGIVRAEVDPQDAAIVFLGMQNGLLAFWLLDPESFSLKERAEAMVEIYLRGIAA